MRVAWFAPLARRSAIGLQSVLVLRSLARLAEVVVYGSAIRLRAEAIDTELDVRPIHDIPAAQLLAQLGDYDIVVYTLGDHLDFHREIYELALRHPGIVILHDLVMHHFFAGYFLEGKKDPDAYVAELGFAHGKEGERFGRSVVSGEAGYVWDKPAMLEFHMALSAIHGALGVVVHSRFAQSKLEDRAAAPILRLDFPEPSYLGHLAAPAATAGELKAKHRIRLVTFGVVNPNKMVVEVIETIGRNPSLRESLTYDVVGDTTHDLAYEHRLKTVIREQALEDQVRLHGYLPDDRLHEIVREADIVINLRNPHFGESSASLADSLYMGKPTIVWNHGYYAEVPDRVAIKISSLSAFETQLERLATHPDLRFRYGSEAWSFARATFNTDRYAERLLQFARQCQYNQPVLQLIDSISSELDQLGISPETNLAQEVIATIGGLAMDEARSERY